MIIPEIIAELAYNTGVFPCQAVTEAIAQREAIIPELLSVLEDARTDIDRIAHDENYMGHIYAMYLLAQFREQRAYRPMVDFSASDHKLIERVLGDVITEDLGRMLASVCDGDIGLICGMIENDDLDEFVRGAALDAILVLVAQKVKTCDEVFEYLKSLFHGKLERKVSFD